MNAPKHQHILITGAATGIGAATARRFVDEGWYVTMVDINDAVGAALAPELGPRAHYIHGDVCSAADMESAVAAAEAQHGPLTSVFANAGIHRHNTLLDISEEEFDRIVRTNIYGAFHTLRAAVPAIIASGGGSVVITASDQSTVGKHRSFAYGLTNGALGQMTKSLSLDLLPQGVRVNAICPGTIRTPMVDAIFERIAAKGDATVDQLWESEAAEYACGRVGEPAEVAALVYFLASDASSFCSGGLYLIDGGLSAGK